MAVQQITHKKITKFDTSNPNYQEKSQPKKEVSGNVQEDEDVYGLVSDKAEQAANQIRRYINGAYKQIEGIQKLLERHKRNKDLDQ